MTDSVMEEKSKNIKNIVKRIIGIVAFFSIGIVMFMAVSYMLRPLEKDFYRNRITGIYAEEENTLDVVGIGSSSLFSYISSPVLWEEYNLTSYMRATPGQTDYIAEELMNDVLRTQSPDLFVIEVRKMFVKEEFDVPESGFKMVTDNMDYTWNRVKMINKIIPDWSDRVEYYFDIIRYHNNWESFTTERLAYIDNQEPHAQKGVVNMSRTVKVKKPNFNSKEITETLPIEENSEKFLRSLLEKCKEENIEVLFIATPWKTNKKVQKRSNYIAKIIEEYGFNYVDCNLYVDEMGIDFDRDFCDPKHTNMWGAEKVTKFIGNYIMENYDLDAEHDEELVTEWDEVAAENRKKLDKRSNKK